MKPTTHIYLHAKNVGKPQEDLVCNGTMKEVALRFIAWLGATTMAKHIEVRIARNEADLKTNKVASVEDFADIFDSLIPPEQEAAE